MKKLIAAFIGLIIFITAAGAQAVVPLNQYMTMRLFWTEEKNVPFACMYDDCILYIRENTLTTGNWNDAKNSGKDYICPFCNMRSHHPDEYKIAINRGYVDYDLFGNMRRMTDFPGPYYNEYKVAYALSTYAFDQVKKYVLLTRDTGPKYKSVPKN